MSILKDENGYQLSQVNCREAFNAGTEVVEEQKRLKDSTVFLRVKITAPEAVCSFSYRINYYPLGKPFTAKPDRWMGAKVGLFCVSSRDVRTGGYADVDWFRIDN